MSVKYKRLRKERNEERRREAAISELVDVVIIARCITLITEIVSNVPFMLYLDITVCSNNYCTRGDILTLTEAYNC